MSSMEINQVLAQMRMVSAQAQGVQPQQDSNVNFADVLKSSVDAVNDTQMESAKLKEAFQLGEPGVELVDVMLAAQKSSVSFNAMVSVRNKLVEAYKDIMNMPV